MQIILADTNKIFGLYRAMMIHNSNFFGSEFVNYIKSHTVYVSTYILNELFLISNRYNIPTTEADIEKFVKLTGLRVCRSIKSDATLYNNYIYDVGDIQILHDALSIKATHILTNNVKDFDIDAIKRDLQIQIINRLDIV